MEDHGVHHDERPRGRRHHPLVLADERLGREALAHVAAGQRVRAAGRRVELVEAEEGRDRDRPRCGPVLEGEVAVPAQLIVTARWAVDEPVLLEEYEALSKPPPAELEE